MANNLKKYLNGASISVENLSSAPSNWNKDNASPAWKQHFNLENIMAAFNQAAPLVNTLSQITDWGLNSLNETTYDRPDIVKDKNPYKMTHGGTMPGSKTFDGESHEDGGVPIDENGQRSANPIAEVEGDEFMHNFSFIPNKGKYIFSKKLGTADMAEGIVDRYSKKKDYKNPMKDPLAKSKMEFELSQVADLNEIRKAFEEQSKSENQNVGENMQQGVMRFGGILGKIGLIKKLEDGGNPLDKNNPLNVGDMDSPLMTGLVEAMGRDQNMLYDSYNIETKPSKNVIPTDTDNTNMGAIKRSGVPDLLRTATLLSDAFQAMRPAEKETPILADQSRARGHLDNLSADLTASKNAVLSSMNEASEQIRNASPSLQTNIARRMGLASAKSEALSQIAEKERALRNSISTAKGQFEQSIAVDDANRKYQNRIDNLQNKAAKEAYLQRLGDNMLGISKMLDAREVANLTIKEGNSMLEAISDNFKIISKDDGSKEISFKMSSRTNKEN